MLLSKKNCTFEGVGQLHTNKIIKSKTKLMKMTIANRCGGSTWQLLLLLNKVAINNKSINPSINARLWEYKIKKGRYDLECDNGLIIENLSDHFETNEQEALTRLISTALRHGAEVQFVVEQLNKSEGTIISFAKAIARSLKKYVPDGNASDEICPNCNEKNTMVYQEGCVVCLNCSASKCG